MNAHWPLALQVPSLVLARRKPKLIYLDECYGLLYIVVLAEALSVACACGALGGIPRAFVRRSMQQAANKSDQYLEYPSVWYHDANMCYLRQNTCTAVGSC